MDIKILNVAQNKGGHTFMVCCEVFVVIMSQLWSYSNLKVRLCWSHEKSGFHKLTNFICENIMCDCIYGYYSDPQKSERKESNLSYFWHLVYVGNFSFFGLLLSKDLEVFSKYMFNVSLKQAYQKHTKTEHVPNFIELCSLWIWHHYNYAI